MMLMFEKSKAFDTDSMLCSYLKFRMNPIFERGAELQLHVTDLGRISYLEIGAPLLAGD